MLTIDQLNMCQKPLKNIIELQRIFADVNTHYKSCEMDKYHEKDLSITIDSALFCSYSTEINYELVCYILFKLFEENLEKINSNGVTLDAHLKDICKNPYFNKYGLIRSIEEEVKNND